MPARATRLVSLALALLLTVAVGGCSVRGDGAARHLVPVGPRADRSSSTLILYDTSGQYGVLGELYATLATNLASHFGAVTAQPVSEYQRGGAGRHTATIYLGSSYGEPLPTAFLDDVAAGGSPILWANENYWQLLARHPEFGAARGFVVAPAEPPAVSPSGGSPASPGGGSPGAAGGGLAGEVQYKGTGLTRDAANPAGVARVTVRDPAVARSLAETVRTDGGTAPWAVRSGSLTYVGELPFAYLGPNDRYLVFADLLFDLLAPGTPERHRALVRIEDVSPNSDPRQLREVAGYLAGKGVPFSVAVIAEYDDPTGRYSGGQPVHRRLRDAPEVVAALRYMVERGGTLIQHGFTHGYDGGANPYGVSGGDYEFFRAHLGDGDRVVLDGPVPEDSPAWASGRLAAGRAEWAAAGLPVPEIFEFPHYTAGPTSYRAISAEVAARYERAIYFPGNLRGAGPVGAAGPVGGAVDPGRYASQFFPYPVRDVYGTAVIPETLGNVDAQGFNQHEARLPEQILDSARRQLVVRDGVASFFYHPFLGTAYLTQLVEGIRALGYTFVPAHTMILRP